VRACLRVHVFACACVWSVSMVVWQLGMTPRDVFLLCSGSFLRLQSAISQVCIHPKPWLKLGRSTSQHFHGGFLPGWWVCPCPHEPLPSMVASIFRSGWYKSQGKSLGAFYDLSLKVPHCCVAVFRRTLEPALVHYGSELFQGMNSSWWRSLGSLWRSLCSSHMFLPIFENVLGKYTNFPTNIQKKTI
jgi:hypothetical protein